MTIRSFCTAMLVLIFAGCVPSVQNGEKAGASAEAAGAMHASAPIDSIIDYRASGTEPFWSLEINDERGITFTQVGQESPVMTPYASPTVDNDGAEVYEIQTESTKLKIRIKPQKCTNDMSGAESPNSVEVNLNGQVFNGCGGPSKGGDK